MSFQPPHRGKFATILDFIRNYTIEIVSKERFLGIRLTVFGWALIALSTVFFKAPLETVSAEVSFIVVFFSATLSLALYSLFESLFKPDKERWFFGISIREQPISIEVSSHLSKQQRIKWIYFRGIVATGGFIAFNIARIHLGTIDNSIIFGADALVFALFASWLINYHFNYKEWIGIALSSFGVLFILYFDLTSFNWQMGVACGSAAIISAFALTTIFFITGIIVRHDNPLCVAFHQCVAGCVLSLLVLACTILLRFIFSDISGFLTLPPELIKSSIISGVLYAAALVCFLRAFLYTEPIVIAVLGYSLGVFVMVFEWFFMNIAINAKDIASFCLITLGCALLIFEQYKKDKRAHRALQIQKPTYEEALKDEFAALKKRWLAHEIDRYTYLSERHEFNKLLIEYCEQIKNLPINFIKVEPNALVFSFSPLNIELEADGGARSAPFEILNFGSYEAEDEKVAYVLAQKCNTILDIGAHIGWYSINFAKQNPKVRVFSFEPIPRTFAYLERNIRRNNLSNVRAFNFGISNEDKSQNLFYFKGGSALASITNLIDHQNVEEIKCKFRSLDNVVRELEIDAVDFIKCDVEGSELFVFEGASQTLKTFTPIIFTELYEEWCQKAGYSSSDVVKLLNSYGYECFQVYDSKLRRVTSEHVKKSDSYNYFFLHIVRHADQINTYAERSGI